MSWAFITGHDEEVGASLKEIGDRPNFSRGQALAAGGGETPALGGARGLPGVTAGREFRKVPTRSFYRHMPGRPH
jgi:hypothetical protein